MRNYFDREGGGGGGTFDGGQNDRSTFKIDQGQRSLQKTEYLNIFTSAYSGKKRDKKITNIKGTRNTRVLGKVVVVVVMVHIVKTCVLLQQEPTASHRNTRKG